MGKRETKKEATKQAIIDAAYLLFYKKGYEATSYTDIAKKAGVGYGTVYSHFAKKADIIGAKASEVLARQAELLKEQHPGDRNALDHAFHLLDLSWQLINSQPSHLISVHLAQRWVVSKENYYEMGRHSTPLRAAIGHYIKKAQTDGLLEKDIDIDIALELMDGQFRQALQESRFGGECEVSAKTSYLKHVHFILRLND